MVIEIKSIDEMTRETLYHTIMLILALGVGGQLALAAFPRNLSKVTAMVVKSRMCALSVHRDCNTGVHHDNHCSLSSSSADESNTYRPYSMDRHHDGPGPVLRLGDSTVEDFRQNNDQSPLWSR